MNELLALSLLLIAFVIFPIWMFRRMRKVRDAVNRQSTERSAKATVATPFIDEIHNADGSITARPMVYDEQLAAADRRATELPDINQTLQGKR